LKSNIILVCIIVAVLFIPIIPMVDANPADANIEQSIVNESSTKSKAKFTVMWDDAHIPLYTMSPSNQVATLAQQEAFEEKSPRQGGYSRFGNAMVGAGFNMVTLNTGQTVTTQILENNKVDVLVIARADEGQYTVSEINAIYNFVNSGGSVLIIGEFGVYGGAVNQIAMKFGASLGSVYMKDKYHCTKEFIPPTITTDDSFIVFTGDAIKKTDSINQVINAGVTRTEFYSTNIIQNYPTWASKLLVGYATSSPPNCPSAVAFKHKKGVDANGNPRYGGGVVMVGDSNFLDNCYDSDFDGTLDLEDSNNKLFGLNIVKWLASAVNRTVDVVITYGVSLTANPTASTIAQGATTNYIIYVTNTGNDKENKDTITLEILQSNIPSSWSVSLSTTKLQLTAGQTATVVLTIKTTKDSEGTFNIAVRGTSGKDHTKSSTITTVTTVKKAKVYDMTVTASPLELIVKPGESADFVINITNIGNVQDQYELFAQMSAPPGWSVALSTNLTGIVYERETAKVTLTVYTPISAIADEFARVKVTAKSKDDPNKKINWTADQPTVTIVGVHKITLSCTDSEHLIKRGGTTSYTITIKNDGNVDETINLDTLGAFEGWTAKIFDGSIELKSYDSIPISAKGTKQIKLEVTAPLSATAGNKMGVIVKNADTSPTPKLKFDPVYTNTTILVDNLLTLSRGGSPEVLSVDPGGTADYVFYIENTGNVNETPTIDVSNIAGWSRTINVTNNTVPSGGSVSVPLSITAPQDALTSDYEFRIVVSYRDMNTNVPKETSMIVTVHVNQIYDINITSKQTYFITLPNPDKPLTGKINLTNNGNGPDYISISAPEYSDWITSTEYRLESGEKKSVEYSIKVPQNPPLNNTITINGTSVGDKSVTSSIVIVVEVKLSELSVGKPVTTGRLEEGKFAPFTATVYNNGSIVAPNVVVALYVDNKRVDTYMVENLLVNHSANATLFWQVTKGDHKVKIAVDPDNTIKELDELGKSTGEIDSMLKSETDMSKIYNNVKYMTVHGYETSMFATTLNAYWLVINVIAIVLLSVLTMTIARGSKQSVE